MENQKGVTLIVLMVTIIVMLIIAGVGIYAGGSSIENAKEQAELTEIKMIQQAVVENYTKYMATKNRPSSGSDEDAKELYLRGTAISYEDASNIIDEMNSKMPSNQSIKLKVTDYGELDTEKHLEYYYRLRKEDLEYMEIKTAKEDTYIVNYSTGEVINATRKFTIRGRALYVYGITSEEQKIIITATPDRTDEYATSQDVTINVQSKNSIEELNYKWTNILKQPKKEEITTSVPSNKIISTPSVQKGEQGNYYLWIYAKDDEGNEIITSHGGYMIKDE